MNKYVKNYFLSIANTVFGLLFPIITFPYVARVLGTENLGIINFTQGFGYYFTHLASFGINSYGIREVSKVRDNKEKINIIANEIFNLNFFFSLISGIIYLGIVFAVPKFRANLVVYILYSFVIFSNFLTLDWLLQSYDDYLFSTVRSILIRTLSLAAVFVFVKKGDDYIIYMLISCIVEMGNKVSNLIHCRRKYVALVFKTKFLNFRIHIKSMFTLFSFRLVNGISTNLDKVMIGFLREYEDVGIYSSGVKFTLMIAPIVESLGVVLFPKINIAANKSKDDYISVLNLNYNMILAMGIPMAVGMFLVSPRLILLFAGEEYYYSINVSRIMSIIILLIPIGDLLGSKTLLVYKKDKQLLICSCIVAVSNVLLNAVFIPIWGINGAAIASVISYIVAIASRYYFTRKIIKFSLFSTNLIRYLAFTAPFVIIYAFMRKLIDNNNIIMFSFVVVCTLIYLIELIVFKDPIWKLLIKKIWRKNEL